ncbi:MAG: hypothetical protein KC591_10680 [Gemmatimonadetes bacterium]|nr:hypothetical protein [Gemmatimonadota bacterium]
MPHGFEIAPSGRAKCRACGRAIAKGELRFGERLPNPYAEGEMTLWFHPECGALARPETFREALPSLTEPLPDRERLEGIAALGVEHRRLPRVCGAERSPSGRAKCRACREPIPKDAWRIKLQYFQDARFEPAGAIHAHCAAEYLGTADVVDRARHFTELTEADSAELRLALASPPAE